MKVNQEISLEVIVFSNFNGCKKKRLPAYLSYRKYDISKKEYLDHINLNDKYITYPELLFDYKLSN